MPKLSSNGSRTPGGRTVVRGPDLRFSETPYQFNDSRTYDGFWGGVDNVVSLRPACVRLIFAENPPHLCLLPLGCGNLKVNPARYPDPQTLRARRPARGLRGASFPTSSSDPYKARQRPSVAT